MDFHRQTVVVQSRELRELNMCRAVLTVILIRLRQQGRVVDIFKTSIMAGISWSEIGVSQIEFKSWWRVVQSDNDKRIARKAEEKKLKALRRSGLKKLTVAEREALFKSSVNFEPQDGVELDPEEEDEA